MNNFSEKQMTLYNQILTLSNPYTNDPQKQGIYDVSNISALREKIVSAQLNNVLIGLIITADRITDKLQENELKIDNLTRYTQSSLANLNTN